jgi:hypothetical protein
MTAMRRRSFSVGLLSALACGGGGDRPATPPDETPPVPPRPAPAPTAPTPPPATTTLPAAALAERAEQLRARLGAGFTVLVEPPFVVAGNEPATAVERRAATTIRWSVEQLKREYFAADPAKIVEIYLFGDSDSYARGARELFDDEPDTPYGYYSPAHEALIMNIATGGGTLVHEIVHPFVASNFPACPAWFNEGLASLYEQCSVRDGRIIGLPNWRLPELQRNLRSRRAPSLATLTATSTATFYGARSGLYYAQARYLCHYLQERGLLRDYYHAFVAAAAADPTGLAVLMTTTGHDVATLDRELRQHALALRWPT